MALSKRLRFEILRRDGHTCRYCGRSAPDVPLRVDHVTPVALGGQDDPTNLVTACADCNSGKSSIQPGSEMVANVAQDALKWARAIEAVVWSRAQQREAIDAAVEAVDMAWGCWTWTDYRTQEVMPMPRDSNWPEGIERFYNAGLDPDVMVRFVGVAMRNEMLYNKNRWSYFCGCCWREIDAIQEEARKVVQFGEQWAQEVS